MTKYEANTKQNKKGGEVLNFSKGRKKGKNALYFTFETFITPFNFHQIQLPGTLLNAELNQLSESGIGFKIWRIFYGDMNINTECRIAVS